MSNIENDLNDANEDFPAFAGLPKIEVKVEPTKVEEVVKEIKKAITVSPSGLLMPTDSAELWRLAEQALKSRAIPKTFENVPQVMMAIQFCNAQNLNWTVAIRQMMIVNGSLSVWGDLPLALVEASGLLEEKEEVLFDSAYNPICYENKNLAVQPWGAVCIVKRKDRKAVSRSFTMEEAKLAGLLTKNNSIWKYYPKRMLQMRARSLALKDVFAEVLNGIAINEYDHNIMGEEQNFKKAKSVESDVAGELNRGLLKEEEKTDSQPQPTRLN